MKIGFDCDDTTVDFVGSFIKYHDNNYGTKLDFQKISSYDMAPLIGVSPEIMRARVKEFYDGPGLENLHLINGAKEVLLQLKAEGNELYIITARPKPLEERTINYFNNNLPNVFKEIYLRQSSQNFSLNGLDKGEVCQRFGLKFFMEDGLHYAKQCAEKGTRVILFNAPWNQCSSEMENEHRFIRVFSWRDVPNTIKTYSAF